MTQSNILRMLIAVVVVALLTVLQGIFNVRRSNRGRQAALPLLCLVTMIIGMISLSVNYQWAADICAKDVLLENGEILLLNAALVLIFLAMKLVLCPIITSLWKKQSLMELTSAVTYEYDAYYNTWFLRKKWADLRWVVRIFVIVGTLVCGVMLGITWIGGMESPAWLVYFPCAALAVINEGWCFLDGLTKEEFLHDVMGEDSTARRVSNFFRIRDIFEKLFAPQNLTSHTGCEFAARESVSNLLKAMERSGDKIDENVANYFQTYGKKVPFDTDCIQATSKMMHNKSVVFFNPFYRDMTPYITLPLINTLLLGKKCLVIAGRQSTAQDAALWLRELLKKYLHVRSLWRVEELSKEAPDCEIGILSFRQLYDNEVLERNREFFNESDFVLMLEPSIMVNTGQVGLTIIAEETARYNDSPVYCICDRFADGLVDTMSHVLRTEITDVVAMPVPRCIYTGMGWDAAGDYKRQQLFDKQTRFLGNGIELAAVAVKNQVPQVTWYSDTKVPLRDVQWIAGQHHSTICRYMNIPSQQKNLYEKIKFVPSLWAAEGSREQFVIAEDEFCNLFSMLRTFLSRGRDQIFVNILSENYLLRDYMRCNQQMFLSNPHAIPSLIPDYAKTERNTLIKLLILMSFRPVSEKEVVEELLLAGCEFENVYDQLVTLLKRYTFADSSVLDIHNVTEDEGMISSHTVNYYSITPANFAEHFSGSLKNAYYIVEDEKRESEYIDAKMFGHVTQTILPGQYVVYDGKYYLVKMVSARNGIILRRASDLYTGRKYYRQMRSYVFDSCAAEDVVFARKVMDMEISILRRDFRVNTNGYLEMKDNQDLRSAKVVDMHFDPDYADFCRHYHNKNVLQIRLPDTDENIRFTICLLLNEVFRSVFPDAWQYLAVLAKRPGNIDGMLENMAYMLEGDAEDDYIYVVEDSDLDLGLLDAVYRYLNPLMELITDFLDWHFEKIREPARKDPVLKEITLQDEDQAHKSFLSRIAMRLKRIFGLDEGKKKPEAPAPEPKPAEESPAQPAPEEEHSGSPFAEEPETGTQEEGLVEEEQGETAQLGEEFELGQQDNGKGADQEEAQTEESAEPEQILPPEEQIVLHTDGEELLPEDSVPDDLDILMPIEPSRYQKECYLKFGFDEIDSRLKIEDVKSYLTVRGWSNSSLTKARKRTVLEETTLDLNAENQCDFCGIPLSGVSYDRLNDGRIRCNDCSMSAITQVDEFRDLFLRMEMMMENTYNIQIPVPIAVKTTDARTIARHVGMVFVPSTKFAARVLGFAQRKNGKFSLFVENGSPRLATIDTTVHELTHIWQYLNWKDADIMRIYAQRNRKYTRLARDLVYEGMAMWSAIQMLYVIGETTYARKQELLAERRKDVYGVGFRMYRDRYDLCRSGESPAFSPFTSYPPLDPAEVRKFFEEEG